MPVVIGGINCYEIVKGYTESMDSSCQSTKSYITDWATRYRVMNGMTGVSSLTIARNGAVTFQAPFRHPETSLFAKSISVRGVGQPFQGARQLSFPAAVIDVTFGVLSWDASLPTDDPAGDMAIDPETTFLYATQSISYGAEYHTIPGSNLQVNLSPPGTVGPPNVKPFNAPAQVKVSHAEMTIKFHKLPYMPTNFLPLFDNVNADTFLGCKRGQVRFSGATTEREEQSDGTLTQSVTMTFSYRPSYDWNFVPNPYSTSGGKWVALQYKNGDPIFPYTDLSVCFPDGYSY